MGFAIFTKNGTFSPVAYGLRPGSDIFVAAIGGGAGTARLWLQQNNFSTCKVAKGGNGGASSFGSYLTAPGAAGSTSYNTGAHTVPSPTVGGLVPEKINMPTRTIGIASSETQVYLPDAFSPTVGILFPEALGGIPARSSQNPAATGSDSRATLNYISNMSGGSISQSPANAPAVFSNTDFRSLGVSFTDNRLIITSDSCQYMRGGACGDCSVFGTRYNTPTAGIGYGVGGVGMATYWGGQQLYIGSAKSAEPVKRFITLTNVSDIPITVGGGGASGGFLVSNTTTTPPAAENGTGGAAGKRNSNYTYSADGGYGDVAPGTGAGAGGCVAVWW